MALNRRQQKLYLDRITVWPPMPITVGADKRPTGTSVGSVNPTPTYEDIPAKYFPSSEYNANSWPLGRTLQDNMLTLDVIHTEASVNIDDSAVILLTTPGIPDSGTYYRVQGNQETWAKAGIRDANLARVFMKRIPRPVELDP